MIVLELAESFLPRECSGAERDGWGDDRGLAAKRRKTRKNRMRRLTADDRRRRTDDGRLPVDWPQRRAKGARIDGMTEGGRRTADD